MARRLLAVVAAAISLSAAGCVDLAPLVAGQMQEVLVKKSPRWFERNRVAIIDVDGFLGVESGWLLRGTTVADVREKLDRAAADPRVKAVVLRINSPGGEANASDTIYHEVARFRQETGKPVVAALLGTAASGGYYVAVAADRIVASPTSVTGSVGVVMHFLNVEGLYGKLGLRSEVIKSGDVKDIGSPLRAMTPEERAILAGVNKELFQRFLTAVTSGRTVMSPKDVETISDGRIVAAQEALDLHMVDRIGYLDDAIAEAFDLAGVEHADVILYRPFPHYNTNVYAASSAQAPGLAPGLEAVLSPRGPAFLYLWAPGQ
jgi:protease-4